MQVLDRLRTLRRGVLSEAAQIIAEEFVAHVPKTCVLVSAVETKLRGG